MRNKGDYGAGGRSVDPDDAARQIDRAEKLLAVAEELIGPTDEED